MDTCTFLWIVSGSPELSDTSRRLYTDPDNDVFLSVVSAWEILVKHNLGKLPLPEAPHKFIKKWRSLHSIDSLQLDEASVLQLSRLPEYHKDPFDRILICQAIANSLVILTPDTNITKYPVRVEW
ncbi:MAG TPA: type II toxin-antitoxin system VapC family toxin [Thermodesulfovibrionales bacterium]|nr:type II toxin-antitoxin system VapC family toxin [Thermodesulfovibrionales bacterium]